MKRNIIQKLRSLWRNKVEDTTKEWEETGETLDCKPFSKYSILVNAPLILRLKFLVTNRLVYRLIKNQFLVISRNPLREER